MFSYRSLLRLGSGLALVCSAGVFTVLGLCFGESALASGGGGGAQPTEDAWFTVAMPIATWLLTLLAVGWLEALGAETAPRFSPFVACACGIFLLFVPSLSWQLIVYVSDGGSKTGCMVSDLQVPRRFCWRVMGSGVWPASSRGKATLGHHHPGRM